MAIFDKQAPGVYIEELPGGARPIVTPSTAVLAIVGLCRDTINFENPASGKIETRNPPTTPTLVTSWQQFASHYGGLAQAPTGTAMHQAMWGFFLNGGKTAFVVGVPVTARDGKGPVLLPRTGTLSTANGQETLRLTTRPLDPAEEVIVRAGPGSDASKPELFNITYSTKSDPAPKTVENLTLGSGRRNVKTALQAETQGLLLAEILNAQGAPNEIVPVGEVTLKPTAAAPATDEAPFTLSDKATTLLIGDAAKRTGIAGLEAIEEVTLVICPDLVALRKLGMLNDKEVLEVQAFMINHCENMKDRFAILDAPFGKNVQEMMDWRKNSAAWGSGFAALYYPWIEVKDKEYAPPSGYLAGVYARTDSARGVHKAPANEEVGGAIGLELNVTQAEQGFLNPIGVNVIRKFPNRGIRVWGARTLESGEWKYINVRRLFSNIEEAILQGTQWTVFEPNDRVLWAGIRREVTDYLTLRWREGALFGATPEEAFYVVCDETINDQAVRDQGYCLIEVGIAPVKPAEFIVFMIRQKREETSA
ncbi:MAG: phage tail sheath family protein [Anaerolineae bacterium]|nr:phage tail sheath family protein [Anaerolineae bacterium]